MKLYLQTGTHLAFKDARVYELASQMLIEPCKPACSWDHDHYPEPYVVVNVLEQTAFPLSTLTTVFNTSGDGRTVTNPNTLVKL